MGSIGIHVTIARQTGCKMLQDVSAERAVLAGLCQYGADVYFDIADLLQPSTFTLDSNKAIYECIQYVVDNINDCPKTIDTPLLYSAAASVGILEFLEKPSEVSHLKAVLQFRPEKDNIRFLAAKIRKLEVGRLIQNQLKDSHEKYEDITGEESITQILSIAEDSIFNFSSLLKDEAENEPQLVFDNLYNYVKHLGDNPVDQLGISTGFPNYDKAIGGGLRPGTVSIIGARAKIGKSLLSDNMGYNIACQGIPVLNLDTEMRKEDHQHRMLAMVTDCYIHDIETGKYSLKPGTRDKILKKAQELEEKQIPYSHLSISGMSFEEQLAITRRWITQKVGLTPEGKAKPCVVIYDYLKLMSADGISADMKEYQMLGFMMTTLHNFAMRYQIPVLSFIQLNRDGIKAEDTDVVSGSDRIVWLCSNFTIFKKKSDEEIAEEEGDHGDRKLVPIISRHGGWDDRNYINCHMNGAIAKITEGKTKFELMSKDISAKQGFIEESGTHAENDIPF